MNIPNLSDTMASMNAAMTADTGDSTASGTASSTPAPVVTDPTPAVTIGTTATGAPPAPVTTPTPVAPAANDVITVDFGGGRTEQLTREQAAQRIREQAEAGLREDDYRRKTQELAATRQQYEAQQLQLQQQAALLQNPLYQQQLLQQWQQQQIQQQRDPNQPVTYGEIQQLIQHQQIQQQQLIQTAEQRAQQIVSDKLQTADFATKFNQSLETVMTKHPVLKVNPKFEDQLRFEVAQLEPKSIDEANRMLADKAAVLATSLDSFYQQRQQAATVHAQQQLVQGGTVPPGGVAVQQQAQTNFTVPNNPGKMDWGKFNELARDVMKAG